MRKKRLLLVMLLSGAAAGYMLGLCLSLFKTKEGISTYNFQTVYVPELLALVCTIPALLLYVIISSKQNTANLHQNTLRTLSQVIEKRDYETGGHCERVAQYAMMLGEKMGIRGRSLLELGWGAYLHDIGKIAVPDRVLLKPGKLSDEEWDIVREHVHNGYQIVKDCAFLGKGKDVILFHHERWDGYGYPFGLKGQAIPLFARLFSVVDTFDAMTSSRHYRKGMSFTEAKAEIARQKGTQFCPDAVEAFLSLSDLELVSIFEGETVYRQLEPLSVLRLPTVCSSGLPPAGHSNFPARKVV